MLKPDSRLNKSDRQALIVAELRGTPTLRVNELADMLWFLLNRAPRSL